MKKGFTLIELLSVIIILAIILVIAVPRVLDALETSKENVYITNERMLKNAARNYLANNVSLIPSDKDQIYIVNLEELITNKFINEIKISNTNCEGFVICKNNKEIDYYSYLKCGNHYESENYETLETLENIEVLVVAGGGAGGSHIVTAGTSTGAGGGGAGGLIHNLNYSLNSGTSYSVIVGKGGISPENSGTGGNGENSVFSTLTAIGGGGGGFRYGNPNSGGSGGGVGYFSGIGGNGTTNQGNSGGSSALNMFGGAGGGGFSEIGSYSNSHAGSNGGSGIYLGDIFGNDIGYNGYFASGGGGGSASGNPGGLGGLGAGNGGSASDGTSGIENTGSGGGGSGNSFYIGGDGGSGIVLIKYPGLQKANGGEVYEFNGYTIHAFKETKEQVFDLIEL